MNQSTALPSGKPFLRLRYNLLVKVGDAGVGASRAAPKPPLEIMSVKFYEPPKKEVLPKNEMGSLLVNWIRACRTGAFYLFIKIAYLSTNCTTRLG